MQRVRPFGDHFGVQAAHHLASRAFEEKRKDTVDDACDPGCRHAQPKSRCRDKMLAIGFADIAQMLGHVVGHGFAFVFVSIIVVMRSYDMLF